MCNDPEIVEGFIFPTLVKMLPCSHVCNMASLLPAYPGKVRFQIANWFRSEQSQVLQIISFAQTNKQYIDGCPG